MTIGILAIDYIDYHDSVAKLFKGLNLKSEKETYTLLDLTILPIIYNKDTEKKYDQVVISLKLREKIDQFAKVRKSCKIG